MEKLQLLYNNWSEAVINADLDTFDTNYKKNQAKEKYAYKKFADECKKQGLNPITVADKLRK
jgi:hypothetical protein